MLAQRRGRWANIKTALINYSGSAPGVLFALFSYVIMLCTHFIKAAHSHKFTMKWQLRHLKVDYKS